jgi:hypothetical protein
MTKIEQRKRVRAPVASAKRYIGNFFVAHKNAEGDAAHVTVHAGKITRDTLVILTPVHRPGDMLPRFSAKWKPFHEEPYPDFNGELDVAGDEDYNSFWLILEGEYEEPGRFAGETFDATVAKRIAENLALQLLTDIRDEIERLFSAEEENKIPH